MTKPMHKDSRSYGLTPLTSEAAPRPVTDPVALYQQLGGQGAEEEELDPRLTHLDYVKQLQAKISSIVVRRDATREQTQANFDRVAGFLKCLKKRYRYGKSINGMTTEQLKEALVEAEALVAAPA